MYAGALPLKYPEEVTNNRPENIDCLFRCDQDKIYKECVQKAIEEGKEGSKCS